MNEDFEVIGCEGTDKASGFKGVIIGVRRWLNGCVQYAIQPKVEKGKVELPDATYIDEGQVAIGKRVLTPPGLVATKGRESALAPGGASERIPSRRVKR